ncbi:hypothetical protein Pmani_017798 [Petrolisthes manimaculis]|uniref:GPN-loop GTPase 2 n=1 Tax=Petrolisthes manimaculis TaxID=1843537 RepID=A0AAE1U5F9_9EUCA|nr:hypothetical protein Pmani_017798 [Petrolisthes manimaculis]
MVGEAEKRKDMVMDDPLVDHQLLQLLNHCDSTPQSRPRSVNTKVFTAQINGTHTDFLVIVYSNRVFVCVTQCGKIGNLFSIHCDETSLNPVFPAATSTSAYDIKCILGVDSEDSLTPVLVKTVVYCLVTQQVRMTQFGQVVMGPPGSGKTSYCRAVASLLKSLGRKVAVINLDPANDTLPYEAAADICELVSVEEVMEVQGLGPNGALIYCMEVLEASLSWLTDKVNKLKGQYLIFDFPGQAELYCHHTMVRKILSGLEINNTRLCSVYLIDSHYANDPGKYISAVMLTLNSMLMMELPTVNVLSKVDSVEKYGSLDMGLEFYTEVQDLDYLVEGLEDSPVLARYHKLNKAMAEVATDYSLVSYIPVSIESHSSLLDVIKAVDKANGYVYGTGEERNIQQLLSCAVGAKWESDRTGVAREEWMKGELEEEEEEEYLRAGGTMKQHQREEEELLKMIATQNQK